MCASEHKYKNVQSNFSCNSKTLNQAKCASTGENINKLWHFSNSEILYRSATEGRKAGGSKEGREKGDTTSAT